MESEQRCRLSSPWAVCAAAEFLWTHLEEGHQSQPIKIKVSLNHNADDITTETKRAIKARGCLNED